MMEIQIARLHDLEQLERELLKIVPGLRPGEDGTPRLALSERGDAITIACPDDADEALIRQIVGNHTPVPKVRTLTFEQPNDLSKLHDELLAAVPELRPVDGLPVLTVRGLGDDLTLYLPEALPAKIDEAVRTVVKAHDPTPRPEPPSKDARIAAQLEAAAIAVEGASTLAQVKAAQAGLARALAGILGGAG